MALSSSLGRITADAKASGGKALTVWANGAASKTLTTAATADRLEIRVRGSQCRGAPVMVVRVDGVQALKASVRSTSYTQLSASVKIPAGARKVAVGLVDELRTTLV